MGILVRFEFGTTRYDTGKYPGVYISNTQLVMFWVPSTLYPEWYYALGHLGP